ncbi:hypothetical protein [Paracidovorax citrulli]|uniref:hypothetical protein n=1 Tax=Paracidovorax citrulli TaxID=80869 RepID=UPI000697AC5E|nr:hypothetical protein [Paracidovorax citrulli]
MKDITMFEIDTITNRVLNTTIADSDGGRYWVGQVALALEPKSTAVVLPAELSAAYAAFCPAAVLVEAYHAAQTPLFRLFIAEALRQEVELPDVARQLGVTVGYLRQLDKGIRRFDQISDDFALSVSTVLCVPRLLVLYIAGRLTEDDFTELDSIGITAANHLADLAERVQQMAKEVVAAATKRIEAEERKSGGRRRLTAASAEQLLREQEQLKPAGAVWRGTSSKALVDLVHDVASAAQVTLASES